MSDVGYKKPPVAHQFKAGTSGNPKGGKRGPRKVKLRPHPFDAKVQLRFGAKLETMTIGRQLVLFARNVAIQKPDIGLSCDLREQHIRIYEMSKKKRLRIIPIKDDAEWVQGDAIMNTTDAVQHLGIGRDVLP